ncbi:MAG: hypothetical protein FJ279_37865, partial [Planctomycetes bacterium]|nr:hypothetical protein [Planctomycetota bacterium]
RAADLKTVARPGEGGRVAASVRTEGVTDGQKMVARLKDGWGRVLSQQTLAAAPTVQFALPIRATRNRHGVLEADLMAADGALLSRQRIETPLPVPTDSDIHYAIWYDARAAYTDSALHWRCKQLGFDAIYDTSFYGKTNLHTFPKPLDLDPVFRVTQMAVNRNDQEAVPYVIPVLYSGKSLVRNPCLSDPGYHKFFDTIMTRGVQYLSDNGYWPSFLPMGDEFLLAYPNGPDVCFGEHCKRSFREYLKRVYGDVAALNREWGARLASFDDAEPITLEDARAKGRPAQWADHRLHMDEVVLRIVKRGVENVRRIRPEWKAGFEGMFRSISECGYDMEGILETVGYLNSYEYPYRVATLRSFRQPGSVVGLFSNTYMGLPNSTEYMVWHAVLNQLNHLFWWRLNGPSGCMSSDLTTANPNLELQANTVRLMESGVGRLMLAAEMLPEPVGLLYSQPSIHASKWYGDRHDCVNSQAAFGFLLQDALIPYRMVRSKDVAARQWPGALKVLVLPHTLSLPPDVAASIKEWVRNGGCV